MKKLLLLSITAIGLLLLFGVSCHKDGPTPQQRDQQHQDSIMALFRSGLGNTYWRIKSQTISPGVNGSNILKISSCDSAVTYNFLELSGGQGNQGLLAIHYYQTPCNGIARPTDPPETTYLLNVNPDILIFPDNAQNDKQYTYAIIKSGRDSLILKNASNGTVTTKVYLSVR